MTEEKIKSLAREYAAEAMLFAIPTATGLQNLGANMELLLRIAFISGARAALKGLE